MAGLSLKSTKTLVGRFLGELGFDRRHYVHPADLVMEIGATWRAKTPRGCHGFAHNDDGKIVVRIDARGGPRVAQHNAGHECGHLVQLNAGVRLPHHEPTCDRCGLLLRMPEPALVNAVRDHTLDPVRLGESYHLVPTPDLYARWAMHLEGWAFDYRGIYGQWRELAHDLQPPPSAMMLGYRLAAEVADAGRWVQHAENCVAVPYVERTTSTVTSGIVVVVPPALGESYTGRVSYTHTQK